MKEILLLPCPRKVEKKTGIFTLEDTPKIYYAGKSAVYKSIIKELGAKTEKSKTNAQVKLLSSDEAPEDLSDWIKNPEGYALEINKDGVCIYASQPAGYLYGSMTLNQLRRQYGPELPCLKIGDVPVLKHRGAMLSFPQGHTAYRASYMRNLVPQLARWKINALYLYLETNFVFPSIPYISGPEAMKPSDAREIDKLCKAYNIKLIPQLNVLGHCGEMLGLQKYHKLMEWGSEKDARIVMDGNLCACSPEVEKVINCLLEDIMNCFSSDIIHVGGDEVSNLGVCPVCAPEVEKSGSIQALYMQYFMRVKEILNRRGRKMGIWGDMLLHYYKDIPAEERKVVLNPLSNGTVIYDWSYDGSAPEEIEFFVKEGFETIACSSTNLFNSASFWPYQSVNQRLLFADAAEIGASGGMTTAWLNFMGLHEEHFNYLSASGGTALWSGATKTQLAPGLSMEQFEKAYSLLRYGLKTDALTKFWHLLGDAGGPVLKALAPLQGTNIRNCLYRTDNVLTFWKHYCSILKGEKLEMYREAISQARKLWNMVQDEAHDCRDPYLHLQSAPLLMHEHLIRRFDITEAVYDCYDKAAEVQFDNRELFTQLLEKAASILLSHIDDFTPVEEFLEDARKLLGLERSSIIRLKETKRNIRRLADFLKYLSVSNRPLPVFIQLHDMFLDKFRNCMYIAREQEWAKGPKEFRQYSILDYPWDILAAKEEREENVI